MSHLERAKGLKFFDCLAHLACLHQSAWMPVCCRRLNLANSRLNLQKLLDLLEGHSRRGWNHRTWIARSLDRIRHAMLQSGWFATLCPAVHEKSFGLFPIATVS